MGQVARDPRKHHPGSELTSHGPCGGTGRVPWELDTWPGATRTDLEEISRERQPGSCRGKPAPCCRCRGPREWHPWRNAALSCSLWGWAWLASLLVGVPACLEQPAPNCSLSPSGLLQDLRAFPGGRGRTDPNLLKNYAHLYTHSPLLAPLLGSSFCRWSLLLVCFALL